MWDTAAVESTTISPTIRAGDTEVETAPSAAAAASHVSAVTMACLEASMDQSDRGALMSYDTLETLSSRLGALGSGASLTAGKRKAQADKEKSKIPTAKAQVDPVPPTLSRQVTKNSAAAEPGMPESSNDQPPSWYSPGRIRLRDVHPRRALERTALVNAYAQGQDDAACLRFSAYCKGAAATVAGGRAQYMMTFSAQNAVTAAPAYGEICDTESEESSNMYSDEEDAEQQSENYWRQGREMKSSLMTSSLGNDKDNNPIVAITLQVVGGTDEESKTITGEDDQSGMTRQQSLGEDSTKASGRGNATSLALCSKNHAAFLRDRVYTPKCWDLRVHANSGVRDLLTYCDPCFCCLTVVSFRNFLLGDRGVLGLLPLFRFSRCLQSVNLSGNLLKGEGVSGVLSAFQEAGHHLNLLICDLSNNPISSPLADELLQFITQRVHVVLLGLAGTSLPQLHRQRLLRQSLSNFSAADPQIMIEAWKLTQDSTMFADRDLWVSCVPFVQKYVISQNGPGCMTGAFFRRNTIINKTATLLHGENRQSILASRQQSRRGSRRNSDMSGGSSASMRTVQESDEVVEEAEERAGSFPKFGKQSTLSPDTFASKKWS
eukprot:gnl/TRDRNA2_/TRDRNA2_193285_c0_seq1.p1 gnl/TRDRNA2_/TRDRNA2_193285_c0~~gnl/TRDRNA2_/TRDRNA2_193285_c0_seq1.p1  ORF type:complete len:634 (-),score=55.52 gnl/TRDRNA2_/TRDRNA2_193285_c0_seq1:156-1970(-)